MATESSKAETLPRVLVVGLPAIVGAASMLVLFGTGGRGAAEVVAGRAGRGTGVRRGRGLMPVLGVPTAGVQGIPSIEGDAVVVGVGGEAGGSCWDRAGSGGDDEVEAWPGTHGALP